MAKRTLRIATRGSALALFQTRWVASLLKQHHPELEIEEVPVVTKGDRVQDKPLYQVGGKGLFISEVEAYVVRGEADIAVHSLKDVPGDQPLAEGHGLLCFPERHDPHDVLVTRDGTQLMELERATRIGTTSLRRAAQLRAQRPDCAFVTLRGNVGTRLSKLDDGQYGAIVLAAAGLKRLELFEGRHTEVLDPEVCLPAVGQGTVAIEGKLDDPELQALLAPIEHAPTRLVTMAERAFLERLQGSCRVPIAGHARLRDDEHRLEITGLVGDIDGDKILSGSNHLVLSGDTATRVAAAVELGQELADNLIAQGARGLMLQAEATIRQREKQAN